jgi:hypothetical protein
MTMLNEVSDLQGVGEKVLEAFATHTFEALQACLQPDVSFRALVPPGVREAMDASVGGRGARTPLVRRVR